MTLPTGCPYCGGQLMAGVMECPSCGNPIVGKQPEGALRPGTVLGNRYRIDCCIGMDGEGYIYAASQVSGGLSLRIKEFFPLTMSGERAEDGLVDAKLGSEVPFKTARMDFEDLYHTLQQVTPATGLTAVLDVLNENNTVYAVMEQNKGQTLSFWLRTHRKPMRPAEVRSLLQPIMEGTAILHKAGLIHRGICPDNIVISPGGVACLTGYATQGLRTMGSELKSQIAEGYAAPEQYSAAEFEGRYTDVYGLAAVVYRLVTGQTPVSARQRKIRDSLEPAEEFGEGIPAFFSGVLEMAMNLDPATRVQNVPELMGALASQSAANAMLGMVQERQSGQISTRSILAGAMVIIVMLLLLLAWCIMTIVEPKSSVEGESNSASASQSEQGTDETESSSQTAEVLFVPNFVGKKYVEVQYDTEYLSRYRFVVTEEYSSEVPEGIILSQNPAAGSSINDSGILVNLVVSKGSKLVVMPNIIGFTRDNAISLLNEQGIQFSLLMLANNGEYAAGCVARTDVPVGTEISTKDIIVNVYIAADRDNTAAPTYEDD